MRPRRIWQLGAILAVGCLTAASADGGAKMEEVVFEEYEVVIDTARRLTVVPGFLLDGAVADLAVVGLDKSHRRRLGIYQLGDGAWVPALDAPLRPGVLFVDIASIGGRDRLITYDGERLSWFDPDSASERTLVALATSYQAIGDGGIPHVDVTRDLNHDGRDDLLVPDVDGFWVSVQESDGSFTEAVKLGPPEPFAKRPVGNLELDGPPSDRPRSYGDVAITAQTIPVYLSRAHEIDQDLDGRSDLVFWNGDHFEVHHQDELGRFDPVARIFTTDVPFESEGAYSRAFDYSDAGLLSLLFGCGEKTQRTVLHSLRDLNGDRVADLVTLTLTGRSLTRQRSVYRVHLGAPTPEGVAFARQASSSIRARGRAGGMQPWGYAYQWFEDFDGDRQVDVLFGDVAVGIGGMVGTLVGNSVPVDLELYRGDGGIYPERSPIRRKIRRFAPFAGLGNIFFPTVRLGDVNGDGRMDLLVGRSPKELQLFLGVPGPHLLAQRPQKIAVAIPYDERNTWLVDLDRDGRQEVLMHHAPTEHAPHQPHRLTALIAR